MTLRRGAQVLERARKAEAEAVALKAQLKAETTSSKKSLREMEAALAESTALSSKSEREYITLRDSLKGMKSAWRTDVDSLREDMRKREERWRGEVETTGKRYAKLVEESKARKADVQSVGLLREEDARIRREVEDEFREEIRALKERVQSSSAASEKAEKTAECVSSSFFIFYFGASLTGIFFTQALGWRAGSPAKTHAVYGPTARA